MPPPYRPLPPALWLLVGFIALVEVALGLADAGYLAEPSLRPRVFQVGAFWSELIRGGEPIFAAQPVTMFLTHALLHGSFLHMVLNMTILLALGRLTADHYGARAVLPLFLAGAVAGGGAFGLLSTGPYPMVGASGAVFAFFGVWIVWDWRRHRAHGVPVGPVLRRLVALVLLNVVLYFALGGMLAWEAHLGGLLVGLLAGLLLEARRAATRSRARRRPDLGE